MFFALGGEVIFPRYILLTQPPRLPHTSSELAQRAEAERLDTGPWVMDVAMLLSVFLCLREWALSRGRQRFGL